MAAKIKNINKTAKIKNMDILTGKEKILGDVFKFVTPYKQRIFSLSEPSNTDCNNVSIIDITGQWKQSGRIPTLNKFTTSILELKNLKKYKKIDSASPQTVSCFNNTDAKIKNSLQIDSQNTLPLLKTPKSEVQLISPINQSASNHNIRKLKFALMVVPKLIEDNNKNEFSNTVKLPHFESILIEPNTTEILRTKDKKNNSNNEFIYNISTCGTENSTTKTNFKFLNKNNMTIKTSNAMKINKIITRSRNGCWICRLRKKKCSETKPSCDNCKRLTLHCDYNKIQPEYIVNPIEKRKKLLGYKEYNKGSQETINERK
ncbi:hypothetical protein TBLA_0H00520 [Henningerozyma blattae CBS 6284]|uniref:Zn(2)-C6 fungal-type domain-containing protein n=1 Tax=Henningerozyma blattae (strain ATCC 34711 / CBS 6284 / DSM 70876 / NBRC 10599 / NRRL Y-10934 / UCD 77-7) TaxID=1071380 RepID=I2H7J2_HENB6|nr:hypothetical protein TBLA_0H00520 [Tetrapisispora blattae CBS 6284]CCH62344.1 hypothetical protein TBLA_0H00520 [Tetrapisispora blattae CBS 6284]